MIAVAGIPEGFHEVTPERVAPGDAGVDPFPPRAPSHIETPKVGVGLAIQHLSMRGGSACRFVVRLSPPAVHPFGESDLKQEWHQILSIGNLRDLCQDLTSGEIPAVRKLAELALGQ